MHCYFGRWRQSVLGEAIYIYYKGKLAAVMVNGLGIDAMMVDNHEFDDGLWVLSCFIDAVKFPV